MYYDELVRTFPTLEGQEDITLRQLLPSDASALYEILGTPKQYRFIPGSPRKTLAAVANIIGHCEQISTNARPSFSVSIRKMSLLV